MARQVVMSITFRRWVKSKPWACQHCGAFVSNTERHARWHATLEANARRWPPDPVRYSGGRQPMEVTHHVEDAGNILP